MVTAVCLLVYDQRVYIQGLLFIRLLIIVVKVCALAVMTDVSGSAGGATTLLLIWLNTDAGILLILTAVVSFHPGVYSALWLLYSVDLFPGMVQRSMLV